METPEIGGYKSIRMEMEPKSQKPKQFHGVHVSNQPISHFVMERINN